VNKGRELHRGREIVKESNLSAAGRAECAAQLVRVLKGDAPFEDRCFKQGDLCARIARRLARRRQRLAFRLLDVLSRNSAIGRGNAAVVA
jgi:hypothetical protein